MYRSNRELYAIPQSSKVTRTPNIRFYCRLIYALRYLGWFIL